MKQIFSIMLLCAAMCVQAETIKVLRFVPVAGTESEVALDSLRKVVFTRDSVVLISATDGEATPMYKYDFRSILFAESSSPEGLRGTGDRLPVSGEKFIKDGQLFIRRDGVVYTILGLTSERINE